MRRVSGGVPREDQHSAHADRPACTAASAPAWRRGGPGLSAVERRVAAAVALPARSPRRSHRATALRPGRLADEVARPRRELDLDARFSSACAEIVPPTLARIGL